MNEFIELLDGSKLECFPILKTKDETISSEFSLDTTGEYLSVGRRKPLPDRREEERYQDCLLHENVFLFLANADKILSDSRLFLAPVGVVNGMAYTGTSGFRRPTLGIYIEWWLHHKEGSFDRDGNPIWFISGSPLSGASACCSVDRKGKLHHRVYSLKGFSGTWSTFTKVNNRYNEAKTKYMAYSLEEAIDILKGQTDANQLFKTHLRVEKVKYDNLISSLRSQLLHAKQQSAEYMAKIQQLIFNLHKEEAEVYYKKCLNLHTISDLRHGQFLEKRIELRKLLRSGQIDNREYQRQHNPFKKQDLDAENEWRRYERDGLEEIFGKDAVFFSFSVIETLLVESKSEAHGSKSK